MIESQCRICQTFISASDNLLYDGKCYDCHYNPYADQEHAQEIDNRPDPKTEAAQPITGAFAPDDWKIKDNGQNVN